jgi:hypothetical protein
MTGLPSEAGEYNSIFTVCAISVKRNRAADRAAEPVRRLVSRRRPGRLAQLGERLPYKQEVGGSIPSPPTRKPAATGGFPSETPLADRVARRGMRGPVPGRCDPGALRAEFRPSDVGQRVCERRDARTPDQAGNWLTSSGSARARSTGSRNGASSCPSSSSAAAASSTGRATWKRSSGSGPHEHLAVRFTKRLIESAREKRADRIRDHMEQAYGHLLR